MPRPRKARVEGEEASVPATRVRDMEYFRNAIHEAFDKPADPVPGPNGAALTRIVEFFKAEHPELWDSIALCPLQHGLQVMADKLDG